MADWERVFRELLAARGASLRSLLIGMLYPPKWVITFFEVQLG